MPNDTKIPTEMGKDCPGRFGGQRSIELSYGCFGRVRGRGWLVTGS